jgi:tripartite-type tricarboxylate transporter receptor subunit TctC
MYSRSGKNKSGILSRIAGGICLTLGLIPGIGAAAGASDYPNRPINLIVSYAPGGGSDLVVRMLAPFIEKELGNGARIVVMNRPGAGGGIGFGELARATPDGYTIGLINTPNVLTIPIERKSTFSWRSFDLIGNIVDDPGNFAVQADGPIKNLRDLAAYAKEKPHEVTVGTTGVGSDDHLAMLLFQKAAGVKMNHVPFKGAAEVRTALQSQQIVVGAINIGESLQFTKGGAKFRNLGVMSPTRTALASDIPTFKEQGYEINLASLRGLAAPKGLPPEIRDRLVAATERAIANPEFQAKATSAFAPLRYLPPNKYASELGEAEAQFQQLWKEMPWTDK